MTTNSLKGYSRSMCNHLSKVGPYFLLPVFVRVIYKTQPTYQSIFTNADVSGHR